MFDKYVMSYKLLAGAPFDAGNLFMQPGLDAGPINVIHTSAILQGIDGGDFIGNPSSNILHDGGIIPTAGTATFDPAKTYGPDDIIEVFYDN